MNEEDINCIPTKLKAIEEGIRTLRNLTIASIIINALILISILAGILR